MTKRVPIYKMHSKWHINKMLPSIYQEIDTPNYILPWLHITFSLQHFTLCVTFTTIHCSSC